MLFRLANEMSKSIRPYMHVAQGTRFWLVCRMENHAVKSSAGLPTELWEHVADHLTSKEWAQACGTCKATFAVKVRALNLILGPSACLLWASRRWDAAKALSLVVKDNSIRLTSFRAAKRLIELKGLLQLHAVVLDGLLTPVSAVWLAAFLSNCRALQHLSFCSDKAMMIPAMENLCHLSLGSHCADRDWLLEAVETVKLLSNLKTLYLYNRNRESNAECRHIDLTDLCALRNVCLSGLVCEDLQLPRQCELHLRDVIMEGHYRETPFLGDHYSFLLRSVHFLKADPVYEEEEFYLQQTACTALYWEDDAIGDQFSLACLSTAMAFSNVRNVYITAQLRIFLRVPSNAQFKVLHISARMVNLEIEQPVQLAERLEEFSFSCMDMINVDLMLLASAMQAAGKHMQPCSIPFLVGWKGMHLQGGPFYGITEQIAWNDMLSSWLCYCGACSRCLGVKRTCKCGKCEQCLMSR